MPSKNSEPSDARRQALREAEAELSKAVLARREGLGQTSDVLRAGQKLKKLAGLIANRKTWLR